MMRWALFRFKCWSSYTVYFIKIRACGGDDDDAVVSHLMPVIIKLHFFYIINDDDDYTGFRKPETNLCRQLSYMKRR